MSGSPPKYESKNLKTSSPTINPPESRFIQTRDGLRLHYDDYHNLSATRLPLVCLPGLARSAKDFTRIAQHANFHGRRVLALDYRGRGLSDWDANWRNYALDVEQKDIIETLDDAGISEAIFLGTSRGGMHVMRIADMYKTLVRGAILNDIGPKIENNGLVRIKRYVGKLPPLNSMSDAVALLRMTAAVGFPGVDWEDWTTYAQQTFTEKDGKIILRYDPELSHTLDNITIGGEYETYWDEFKALRDTPLLVIRGETSDILSTETVNEMRRQASHLTFVSVPGQGHAPLLLDQQTIGAIVEFLENCP